MSVWKREKTFRHPVLWCNSGASHILTGKMKWSGSKTLGQTQLCIRASIKLWFQDRFSTVAPTTPMLFLELCTKSGKNSDHWFSNHLQAQLTPFFQKINAEKEENWTREVENIFFFSAHAPHITACLLGNCGCHCREDLMQNGRGPITVPAKHRKIKSLVLLRIYHSDCAEFLNDNYPAKVIC